MKSISDRERYEFLLGIGLALTLMIGCAFSSNMDSLQWLFVDPQTLHQTRGEVISSKIESGGAYGGWRFNISYLYKVEGLEFVSSRVHFGYRASDDPSYAQHYIEKYPVGKQIVVFYDPNDPANAVLEPTVKWNGLLDFLLIITLLPIAILTMSAFFLIKSHQQQNQSSINSNY